MTLRTLGAAGSVLALLGMGLVAGRVAADQPHMQSALDALLRAKQELTIAEADKGGHRLAALHAVDRAILETRAGIQFARRH